MLVYHNLISSFLSQIYRPYIQSEINISSRMESSDIFPAFSIFDPIHLPDYEEPLSTYGVEKFHTLLILWKGSDIVL